MRTLLRISLSVIALIAALAIPSAAAAKSHHSGGGTKTVAPPGVSGVQQYVETIPTAHGGQPSNSIHRHHSGGGGGATGGGGGATGGGGGGTGSTGAVPASTQQALASQGAAGQAAAALAVATAPNSGRGNSGRGGAGGPGVSQSVSNVSHAASSSPLSAIFKTLTGSSSGGGMGALLPIILVACLLGFTAIAVARRRRTTS